MRNCATCHESKTPENFPPTCKEKDQNDDVILVCTECKILLSMRNCATCLRRMTPENFPLPTEGDDQNDVVLVCIDCIEKKEKCHAIRRTARDMDKVMHAIPVWMWNIPVPATTDCVQREIQLEELVGQYDLVYMASFFNGTKQYTTQYQHRTLQLSMDPDDNNSTNGSLFGVVEETAKGKEEEDDDGYDCLFDDRFTFRTDPSEPRQDGSSLSFQLCDEFQVHGHLQVLGRTEACPWIPHGDYRRGRDAFLDGLAPPSPFASLEAAREANHRHAHHVPEWMEHHLSVLPTKVLRTVYEFATDRPVAPPAFFFEPGDVLLCVVWDDNLRWGRNADPFTSLHVARRRVGP
jgi:hypothetical protein